MDTVAFAVQVLAATSVAKRTAGRGEAEVDPGCVVLAIDFDTGLGGGGFFGRWQASLNFGRGSVSGD